MSNKLKTPLLDELAVRKEQHPYVKKAYLSYHDDVMDDLQPDITLTPDCQKGYIGGYLAGMAEGLAMANRIHDQTFEPEAPTLNRYAGTGIADDNNKELIN